MAGLRDLIRFERSQGLQLPPWLDRIVSLGIVTDDAKLARRQKIVNVASFAGAINSLARIVANHAHFSEVENYLWIQAASGTFAATAFLIHRLHRYGDNAGAVGLILWFVITVTFAALLFGLQSQVQVYFALSGVILFMFGVENWRPFLAWMTVLCATMFFVLSTAPQRGLATETRPEVIELVAFQSMVMAIVINAALIFYALLLLHRTEGDLERQSARAQALLDVMLPRPVADRIKAHPDAPIADRIENVTILFADLVGFTPVAHAETPEHVVAYLDEFTRTFDFMCEAYGVEKIKTVGDAYMAAGGLHGKSREGAIAVGLLALEMLKAQARRPPLAGRKLALRVGIHCGTAIAGVIGDSRISYDLIGDAVNIASRMQTHGVTGRIQVTVEFRAVAGEAFVYETRGPTEVKGIGPVETCFLVASRETG